MENKKKLREIIIIIGLIMMIIISASAERIGSAFYVEKQNMTIKISAAFEETADVNESIKTVIPLSEYKTERGKSLYGIMKSFSAENGIEFEVYDENNEGFIYVTDIGGIRRFDYGKYSGWIFLVNGKRYEDLNALYTPAEGDVIEWIYCCDNEFLDWQDA